MEIQKRCSVPVRHASPIIRLKYCQQLGKDEELARYIAERVASRTRDVRQAIHVAELCDTREEVDRFEDGAVPGRIF